jgi:hypothetical protein
MHVFVVCPNSILLAIGLNSGRGQKVTFAAYSSKPTWTKSIVNGWSGEINLQAGLMPMISLLRYQPHGGMQNFHLIKS